MSNVVKPPKCVPTKLNDFTVMCKNSYITAEYSSLHSKGLIKVNTELKM